MVYRSSRRQAERDSEPEGEALQEFSTETRGMDKPGQLRRQVGVWRTATIILALAALGLLVAVVVLVVKEDWGSCGGGRCGAKAKNPNFIDLSEPDVPGPFHDLTKLEISKVREFITKDPKIKAADPATATVDSSYMFMMDLIPAKKADTFSGQSQANTVDIPRAICLFENNNGYPIRRHLSYSQGEGAFYNGMMDSVLVFRTALTIVNYDYIADFIFHQNGVLETRVMSTGYIFPSFYTAAERPYGFQIAENLVGSLHHHIFHYKADIDISGTSNRYETLDLKPDQVQIRAVNETYHQVRYERSLKKTEQEALYKYNFDTPMYHVVHNDAVKTQFGEIKAFRIGLHGMSKQLIPEGVNTEVTIPWARHQLAVTKHKDDEFISSSPYAMWDSKNPVTDFSKFYEDNEKIVDEDLVFWITMGMHHIPHTEDLPVTPTVGNHLTFFLFPYNYFTDCPSMASRDQIRIQHKDPSDPTKGVRVERYGRSDETCSLPPYYQEYDQVLENDPDTVLESRKVRGLF
ncbi:hypothetical protein EGW08_017353 [Elysia chlorotica]|uniref:Amine oxidase n=1 Tax=Elysia chlorotica TaxID=188477 RepID=A0A3S1B306_ELYCH|nr:hypothetical protein EGW08_017353 [Elysia chlorotica]